MDIFLKRTLKLQDSISILFSSMVGSGVFVTTGIIYNLLEDPWLVLAVWFLGAVFSMAGAFTFAKLAIIFPYAGGDYIYLKKAYSPLVAFMSGWASLLITFSASISVLGLALGEYLSFVLPYESSHVFFRTQIFSVHLKFGWPGVTGIAIIFLFTFINYFGISRASFFQNGLTFIKIAGLLLFSLSALVLFYEEFASFPAVPDLHSLYKSTPRILIALVPVTFSYLGWNMVTYIAEEVIAPEKNISRTILYGTGLVAILYLMINLAFMLTVPPEDLKANQGIGVISAVRMFGDSARFYFSVFFSLVLLGSLSATIIGGSRIYFAMARDGLFFPILAKLHPHHRSPYMSLIFQAVYSSIFIIFDLEFLLYMITSAILVLSALTAFTVFIFEKRGYKSDYRIPLYPVTPVLYIIGCALLVGYLVSQNPVEVFFGFVILLTAVPVYHIFKRKFMIAPGKKHLIDNL